ncbi:hypothetical protein ACFUV2_17280 [Streptomyces pilosus]|uniref:hypothetical protein n=1 Tax=Streptomyces pilosus TaxID=28893 RepID=UPI0016720B7E|nr:hypothetical protein [Streptomyces pilosus]GGV52140.1 hypothetical protein GCM10010261_32130 [Streptomyces pilosus]
MISGTSGSGGAAPARDVGVALPDAVRAGAPSRGEEVLVTRVRTMPDTWVAAGPRRPAAPER